VNDANKHKNKAQTPSSPARFRLVPAAKVDYDPTLEARETWLCLQRFNTMRDFNFGGNGVEQQPVDGALLHPASTTQPMQQKPN